MLVLKDAWNRLLQPTFQSRSRGRPQDGFLTIAIPSTGIEPDLFAGLGKFGHVWILKKQESFHP